MTARFMTETVPVPVPFEYNAQYFENISDNKYDTDGTTGCFFKTTTSIAMTGTTTKKQVNPVHVHQDTSCKAPLGPCAHVHKSTIQVYKPGESLALKNVKHPHNGKTSVNRLPLMEQDILSQYSGCFEGIGCFPGDLYKFHLKPEYKPA